MNENNKLSICRNCLNKFEGDERFKYLRENNCRLVKDPEVCYICRKRSVGKFKNKEDPVEKTTGSNVNNNYSRKIILIGLAIIILLLSSLLHSYYFRSQTKKADIEKEIKVLRERYASQKRVLWSHVHKILNDSVSPIHSLILLYKDKGDIAERFAKDLLSVLNRLNENKVLVEYGTKKDNVDYGDELVHYLEKVKENKNLMVSKLQEVPVKKVSMFHVLCDESLSEYGPLYYIFTLKDTGNVNSDPGENQNPLGKASRILRNIWSSLPGNDLHPLISRITRNVVEILPENLWFYKFRTRKKDPLSAVVNILSCS